MQFPNETPELPPGGEVPEDYIFDGIEGKVRLSQLFGKSDTLVAYSFMFGPEMERPCPMCTSIIDGLEGNAVHIAQRVDLVVIAKSELGRVLTFARSRGWRNLRFVSSAGNSYNRDYYGEDREGRQWPMMNVFRNTDRVRHTWASELLDAPEDSGQNARHVDLLWPLWNVLDLTPRGRGSDWYPRLEY